MAQQETRIVVKATQDRPRNVQVVRIPRTGFWATRRLGGKDPDRKTDD